MLFMEISGRAIEYRLIPGTVSARPPLVFLHEGLGCAALWRDFPDKVARALNVPALVYSRFGYGQSAGLETPRTSRYLHEEALDVLPAVLEACAISRPLIVGHSDGASIALIHAARAKKPVAGIVLMAPHIMVEEVTLKSIGAVAETYAEGALRARLARYHARVDDAFYGWANIWQSAAFRDWSLEAEARALSIPTLLIQGREDEYGTLAQIERIGALAAGPVEQLVLDACGHAPHRDQEGLVIDAITNFAARHCAGSPT